MATEKPDPHKLLVVTAYAQQGDEIYQGADLWGETVLPKGTKIVQLDYDPERLSKTKTAGQYFTTVEELQKHRDSHSGKVDTVSMSESVQVMARRDYKTDEYKHYANATIYEVVEDMPVAYAKVTDNPAFGKGGADQFYVPLSPNNIIRQEREFIDDKGKTVTQSIGYLKPIETIKASSITPKNDLYDQIKQAESKGIKKPIETIILAKNNAFKKELLNTGDRTVIDKIAGMKERAAFSTEARAIITNEDWKRLKETVLPKPRTPIEKIEFALGGVQNPERKLKMQKLVDEIKAKNTPPSAQAQNQNKSGIDQKPGHSRGRDNDRDIDIGD